jgi:hypothetical protein
MRNLKRGLLALVLTSAALGSIAAPDQVHANTICTHGMIYCECQGYVYCAYDCWMACEP